MFKEKMKHPDKSSLTCFHHERANPLSVLCRNEKSCEKRENGPEQFIYQVERNVLRDPTMCFDNDMRLLQSSSGSKQTFGSKSRDISNNEIIRPRDLPAVTGLSRTSIWRLEKANFFVEKIQLSAGAVGYRRTDIELWLSQRLIKGENK